MVFIPVHKDDIYPCLPIPPAEKAVYVSTSDHGVNAAVRFIEALAINPDDAWAFVSKMYAGGFDLHALRDILPRAHRCQWVQKAGEGGGRGPFMTRSLYVSDPERDMRRLVHLRMIREPDKHGVWKICAVEQEDCPRGV